MAYFRVSVFLRPQIILGGDATAANLNPQIRSKKEKGPSGSVGRLGPAPLHCMTNAVAGGDGDGAGAKVAPQREFAPRAIRSDLSGGREPPARREESF